MSNKQNGIVVRSSRWLLPSAEPVDAALQVPALSRVDTVVVFNGSVASVSQAEILDISVQVPQKDAALYRGLFPIKPSASR